MIAAPLLVALALGADPAPVAPPPALITPPPHSTLVHSSDGTWRKGRLAGTAAALAGVVLLGVAAGFGARTLGLESERRKVCPTSPCIEPTAYRLYEQARTSQNTGVALSVTGGVVLVAGALLFTFGGTF